MHKLVILALALFATLVQGSGLYGGGPIIQQVHQLPNVLGVRKILGGSAIAAASSAPAQVYAARPAVIGGLGLGYGRGYGRPSVAYAPVRSVVLPSVRAVAPGYGVGPVIGGVRGIGLGARGLGLGGYGVRGLGVGGYGGRVLGLGGLGVKRLGLGYGGRPGYGARWVAQPAIATQLTGGPTRYRTYQSPPLYSRVALPVLPSAPVAKLFVPKRPAYSVGPAYGVGPAVY